jgi:heme/copper-type cytochrome/quinol oxidase subunit 1
MKLTPPKRVTFWISVVLALLALVAKFVNIPVVSAFNFWFLLAGFVLLVLGLLIKGL